MKFEKVYTPESVPDVLKAITLSEYKDLPPELEEWLRVNEDVPKEIWQHMSEIDSKASVADLLKEIRASFEFSRHGKKSVKPDSLEDSRFTSFEDVLKRNLDSCGVRARVFGTTLRKLGVPVRFVDGKHEGDRETTDHAWLDIYSPNQKDWIECDPGERDFKNGEKNKRERVFHDWDELKALYEKR